MLGAKYFGLFFLYFSEVICLFNLLLYILVNSYGHVQTLLPFSEIFYPTLGCHVPFVCHNN